MSRAEGPRPGLPREGVVCRGDALQVLSCHAFAFKHVWGRQDDKLPDKLRGVRRVVTSAPGVCVMEGLAVSVETTDGKVDRCRLLGPDLVTALLYRATVKVLAWTGGPKNRAHVWRDVTSVLLCNVELNDGSTVEQ